MACNTTYETPAKFGWVLKVESPISVSRVSNGNFEQGWRKRPTSQPTFWKLGTYIYWCSLQ